MALAKLALALGAVGVPVVLLLAGGAKANEKKKNGGGGPPSVDLTKMTCDEALGLLDPVMSTTTQALLDAPATPENVEKAKKLAGVFRETAPKVGEPYRGAMLVAARCLDEYAKSAPKGGGPPPDGAKPMLDPDGVTSSWDGGPPKKGVASNPKFQWLYAVQPDDNAFRIAARFFGSAGATWPRAIELIQANPREFYTNRFLGSKGNAANPQTSGYNWQNPILAGDRLRVPKTWNRWIDQEGTWRGDASPFPNP